MRLKDGHDAVDESGSEHEHRDVPEHELPIGKVRETKWQECGEGTKRVPTSSLEGRPKSTWHNPEGHEYGIEVQDREDSPLRE